MGQKEVIERSKEGPVTSNRIASDLRALGVLPGSSVLVHSSLSRMGWVCGGAVAVIRALEEVLRPFGTLVMPTHSGDLSDPSGWENPPVPQSWWEEIRASMPAYDPEFTPTSGMGVIPETFRKQPETLRSRHPQVSFAAWGEGALPIVTDHELEFGLGERSPLARIYDCDGWVLLIGVSHSSNTSLHLAEIRSDYPGKSVVPCSAPVSVDGHTRWKTWDELDYLTDDFEEFGREFAKHYRHEIREGSVGYAKSILFRQRTCVDYAVDWFRRKRRSLK